MLLQELASLLTVSRIVGNELTSFAEVQIDSRNVKPGDLFICIPGHISDGHDFAPKVVEAGAAALVTERELALSIPQLIVSDSRYAMAVIANHVYGYPSREMRVIGVTGTNGKTTTTYLIEKILSDRGLRTGLMGNIHVKVGETFRENKATNTQEALLLQRYFRQMVDARTDYCVMEVSSHALELGRVKGTRFRTAVFTNLTQDHLDYHKTMENYKAAKGLLFSRLGVTFSEPPEERQFAVLNADDPASEHYARITGAQVIRYGIDRPCEVRATNVRMTAAGTEFTVESFAGTAPFTMQLVGKFNVYNALGAIAACLAEGIELDEIRTSLSQVKAIDGRMERVDAGQPFLVLVDYAHTPDGLENALSTIREFTKGNVITVFGCGGDRDRTKRPLMGKVAATYSDYVFVTSDNPRTENPETIVQDIVPGLNEAQLPPERYELITDRRTAIQKAIALADRNDVVLIAGKGHETYQDVMGVKHDFDDRLEAEAAIRRRG